VQNKLNVNVRVAFGIFFNPLNYDIFFTVDIIPELINIQSKMLISLLLTLHKAGRKSYVSKIK